MFRKSLEEIARYNLHNEFLCLTSLAGNGDSSVFLFAFANFTIQRCRKTCSDTADKDLVFS
jgi:hypothetical protein